MKIKHMNQLEIAQNGIWTPQKFPAIQCFKMTEWKLNTWISWR